MTADNRRRPVPLRTERRIFELHKRLQRPDTPMRVCSHRVVGRARSAWPGAEMPFRTHVRGAPCPAHRVSGWGEGVSVHALGAALTDDDGCGVPHPRGEHPTIAPPPSRPLRTHGDPAHLGVSVASLIFRCRELGVISNATASRDDQSLRALDGQPGFTAEPVDGFPGEQPALLAQTYERSEREKDSPSHVRPKNWAGVPRASDNSLARRTAGQCCASSERRRPQVQCP